MPCPEGKTISFQGKTQGTNVLLWPSVPDSELCVLIQSPGPHTSPPGNGRNNHSPLFGKEQLSSMQILPNYVKGLTDTRLQLLNESKQGKIKESWSVGQHQAENKPKESLRNTTALGDRPGHPGGGSLSVPKGNGDREEAVEWSGLAHTPHSFVLLIPTCTRMLMPNPAEGILVPPTSLLLKFT